MHAWTHMAMKACMHGHHEENEGIIHTEERNALTDTDRLSLFLFLSLSPSFVFLPTFHPSLLSLSSSLFLSLILSL